MQTQVAFKRITLQPKNRSEVSLLRLLPGNGDNCPPGRRNREVGSFSLGPGLLLTSLGTSIYPALSYLCSHRCPQCSTLSFSLRLYTRLSSYQAFLDILNEMNDYAGQRELIAENMMMSICIDLTKYLQELKLERKTVSLWLIRG